MMDGYARFVIKLKGFDGDKDELKKTYEEDVLPEIIPTQEPTEEPRDPTADPTAEPTPDPTVNPTVDPTAGPSPKPTVDPTVDPTAEPIPDPTVRLRQESGSQEFEYIKPETLDPKNFVICEDECQDEGYWALIGKSDTINFII